MYFENLNQIEKEFTKDIKTLNTPVMTMKINVE
jgi:hypothetical protein